MSDRLTGQVGIRRHATQPVGRLIEWATDSDCHHVVVAITEQLCISAETPHVRIRRISDYPHLEWSRFELTDWQRKQIVRRAVLMNRLPYNTAVLWIIFASRLTRIPVPAWVRDWLKRRRNVDCSQLADLALQAGGIDLFRDDPALVTPADFRDILAAHGWLDPEDAHDMARRP